jgi:hypothetical protein
MIKASVKDVHCSLSVVQAPKEAFCSSKHEIYSFFYFLWNIFVFLAPCPQIQLNRI